MKKYFNTLIIVLFIFIFSPTNNFVIAQEEGNDPHHPQTDINIDVDEPDGSFRKGLGGFLWNLDPVAENNGYNVVPNIEMIIGNTIQVILSFVGILFLILIIISGLQWMMAGGNEETISKAKTRIKNSIYGLAIVLLAYAITYFIISIFINKLGYGG
ncbi:MAG TPA: hypothetical protein PKL13_01005 [bacterium]|nr:hypothetical protein [bacterium]